MDPMKSKKWYHIKTPYGYLQDYPQKIAGNLYSYPCTPWKMLSWPEDEAKKLISVLNMNCTLEEA